MISTTTYTSYTPFTRHKLQVSTDISKLAKSRDTPTINLSAPRVSMFGPSPPSSKWSTHHVPTSVLDLIVDHLAVWAIEEHDCDRPTCHLSASYPGKSNFTPMSPDLRNMSLVNHAFRGNVLSRKIFSSLMLESPEDMANIRAMVRAQTLSFVKHIILTRIDECEVDHTAWASERSKIFALCPNVRSILDESGQVAYYHNYPLNVTELNLVLQYGEKMPVPIHLPGLRKLVIASSLAGRLEADGNIEMDRYTKKALIMLRDIERIDHLHLHLPGTASPGGWGARRLPPELRTSDPLPKTLKEVKTLKITMPYCTVDGYTLREAHWWAYLRWIFDTSPRIHHLVITMDWHLNCHLIDDDIPLVFHNFTQREFLDSMSLQLVKVDNQTGRVYTDGDPTTRDMKDFLEMVLEFCPGAHMVLLDYKANSPSLGGGFSVSHSFRTVRAVKMVAPGSERMSIYHTDLIDINAVQMIIDDCMEFARLGGGHLATSVYMQQMLPEGLKATESRAKAMIAQLEGVHLEEAA